jgi:hypothetical protein
MSPVIIDNQIDSSSIPEVVAPVDSSFSGSQMFVLFTLLFLLAKYFKVGPKETKFGAAVDKLLGQESHSCAEESAVGNERERRLRNSAKKDSKKKRKGGEEAKKNNDDEEDDTFDKV